MTSNQLYRGLNQRFKRRAKQLYRLGFRYTCVGSALLDYLGDADGFKAVDHPQVRATLKCVPRDIPIAYFARSNCLFGRQVIPAALLHHTHNREWAVVLAEQLRQP